MTTEFIASVDFNMNEYLNRIESLEQQLSTVKAELAASQAEKEKVHNKLHSILRRHIEDRITAVELKNELLEILA